MKSPPKFFTFNSFFLCSFASLEIPSIIKSLFPPNFISVPLPAILVAIVIAPGFPAPATISASFSCCLALSTLCFILFLIKNSEIFSDFSMLVVPTNTGWPLTLHSIIFLVIALYFSFSVLKIWSLKSLRVIFLLVGTDTTFNL